MVAMNPAEATSQHRSDASQQMSTMGRKLFRFIEFDDEEQLLAEIHKHPIGAVVQGIVGIGISLALMVAVIVFALNIDRIGFDLGNSSSTVKAILIGGGLLLGLLALAVTAISVVIYRSSIIFVTDQKIAEVTYISIFNRKITQLGIGSVEDVTVHQSGIFARLFNYGTIVVETAGEVENCNFTMMPNPNYYAQKIIQSHEGSVHKYGN